MKSKKKTGIVIIACVVLAIGVITALMTSTQSKTNTFTIGNVSITLTEPNWSASNAQNIGSGAEIAKDPTITNTSSTNACYAFMTVKIPKDSTGELFTLINSSGATGINSGWTELTAKKTTTSTDVTHVYVYGTSSACTSLAKSGTATLFNKIKLADRSSYSAQTYDVVVTGYGIQTNNLGVTDPASIFDLF